MKFGCLGLILVVGLILWCAPTPENQKSPAKQEADRQQAQQESLKVWASRRHDTFWAAQDSERAQWKADKAWLDSGMTHADSVRQRVMLDSMAAREGRGVEP